MLRSLTDRPLVCITLAFALGIVLAAHGALLASVVALLACLAAYAATRRAPWAGGVLLALAALAGGWLYLAHEVPQAGTVAALPPGGQTVVGTVAGAPAYRDGTWRFLLATQAHEEGGTPQPLGGACYVLLHSPRQVARGQRWRLTGRLRSLSGARNPGGRSEAARLASLGTSTVLTVADPVAEPLGLGDLDRLSRHAFTAQQGALHALGRHVGEPYPELTAGVAASVIFGVHAAPPPQEVSDDFRRAGTLHLLVVSGSMVSLVFMMVFLPGTLGARWRHWRQRRTQEQGTGTRGRIRRRPGLWAAALSVPVVVYYAVLTEGGQAVWRAAIMGMLVALAFLLRRIPAVARRHGLTVDHFTLLAAAGLALLALQPNALFTPGVQLTFVAVAALLYLTPKLQIGTSWLSRAIALGGGGTLAAQLGTFPVLAWHFHNAPVAGLGANLLAVPLASVVLMAGLATCLLDPVSPWLAGLLGWVTGWATRRLVWVSGAFASVPWASPEIPQPAWWLVGFWYIALLGLGWWLGRFAARPREGAGPTHPSA